MKSIGRTYPKDPVATNPRRRGRVRLLAIRSLLVAALLGAAWASAQETFVVGLDERRSGTVPREEIAHVYLLDLPAGVPFLTIGVDAFGEDADLTVYAGHDRQELFSDTSLDPYPRFSLAGPSGGRYEIHVMNLLWIDLPYVLHVVSTPTIAGFPGDGHDPGPRPTTFAIELGSSRSGEVLADEGEHRFLLDVPAGIGEVTIALDARGEDIDMTVAYLDGDQVLYADLSSDPYPVFSMGSPMQGRYEIAVVNLLGIDLPYVLHVASTSERPIPPAPITPPPLPPVQPPVVTPPPLPPAPSQPPSTPVVGEPVVRALVADVAPKAEVEVAFERAPGNATDWVGLYPVAADDRQYLAFRYTEGAIDGRLTFTAPSEPGWYEFRLFERNETVRLAISGPFEVRVGVADAPPVASVPVPCDQLGNAGPFQALAIGASVAVTCPAGCPAAGRLWGTDVYTNDSFVCLAARHAGLMGEAGGHFVVTAVEGRDAYTATARHGVDSSASGSWGQSFAVSAVVDGPSLALAVRTVEVGQPVVVSFAGAPANRDWIGLYQVGADEGQHLTCQGTSDVTSGSLTFQAPATPGVYEFRLFDDWAYTRIATSATFEAVAAGVPPPPPSGPTLATGARVVSPGQPVVVSFAGAPGQRDWVGLYREGDGASAYQTWQPTGDVPSGSLTFQAPATPGAYEFRLFSWRYELLVTGAPFDVR